MRLRYRLQARGALPTPMSCVVQEGHLGDGQPVGTCSPCTAAVAEGGVLRVGGEQALSGGRRAGATRGARTEAGGQQQPGRGRGCHPEPVLLSAGGTAHEGMSRDLGPPQHSLARPRL